MNRSKRSWIAASVVGVTALAFAAFVIAQPPGGFAHRGPGHGGMYPGMHHAMHGGGPGGMHGGFGGHLHGLLRDLDLSEEQREQIHTLFESAHDSTGSQREALHTALTDLMRLSLSDGYTDEAASAVVATAAPVLSEMGTSHARTLHQVYEILTADQRQKLLANFERMADHFGGRGGQEGEE